MMSKTQKLYGVGRILITSITAEIKGYFLTLVINFIRLAENQNLVSQLRISL